MLSIVDFVSLREPVQTHHVIPDNFSSRLLVRHPETMNRLRREVASAMGTAASPTREIVRKMPFLACVIKESGYFCYQ